MALWRIISYICEERTKEEYNMRKRVKLSEVIPWGGFHLGGLKLMRDGVNGARADGYLPVYSGKEKTVFYLPPYIKVTAYESDIRKAEPLK